MRNIKTPKKIRKINLPSLLLKLKRNSKKAGLSAVALLIVCVMIASILPSIEIEAVKVVEDDQISQTKYTDINDFQRARIAKIQSEIFEPVYIKDDIWKVTLPTDTNITIRGLNFNNGEDGEKNKKTLNLTDPGSNRIYDNSKTEADGWLSFVEPPKNASTRVLYVKNSAGWNKVYCFVWGTRLQDGKTQPYSATLSMENIGTHDLSYHDADHAEHDHDRDDVIRNVVTYKDTDGDGKAERVVETGYVSKNYFADTYWKYDEDDDKAHGEIYPYEAKMQYWTVKDNNEFFNWTKGLIDEDKTPLPVWDGDNNVPLGDYKTLFGISSSADFPTRVYQYYPATGLDTNGNIIYSETLSNFKFTVLNVENANQFRWAMQCTRDWVEEDENILINITKDLDLGGYLNTDWESIDLDSNYNYTGSGSNNAVRTTVYIEGNGHTIYNFRTSGQGLFGKCNASLIVKNLGIKTSMTVYGGTDWGASLIYGRDESGNAAKYLYNVHVNDSYVQNIDSDYAAALVGRTMSHWGMFVKNCSTQNNIVIGLKHVSGFVSYTQGQYDQVSTINCNDEFPSSPEDIVFDSKNLRNLGFYYPGMFESCYSTDTELFSLGNDSGAFISCGGGLLVRNCFTNNNIYADANTSGFFGRDISIPAIKDDAGKAIISSYFENCYSSGLVEGRNALGGFMGYVESIRDIETSYEMRSKLLDAQYGSQTSLSTEMGSNVFKNCYSSTAVGMDYAGRFCGGFVGLDESYVTGTTLNVEGENEPVTFNGSAYLNCYAAGEVGNILTISSTEAAINNEYEKGFLDNTEYGEGKDNKDKTTGVVTLLPYYPTGGFIGALCPDRWWVATAENYKDNRYVQFTPDKRDEDDDEDYVGAEDAYIVKRIEEEVNKKIEEIIDENIKNNEASIAGDVEAKLNENIEEKINSKIDQKVKERINEIIEGIIKEELEEKIKKTLEDSGVITQADADKYREELNDDYRKELKEKIQEERKEELDAYRNELSQKRDELIKEIKDENREDTRKEIENQYRTEFRNRISEEYIAEYKKELEKNEEKFREELDENYLAYDKYFGYFENCFYDMQTTAMREMAIGMQGGDYCYSSTKEIEKPNKDDYDLENPDEQKSKEAREKYDKDYAIYKHVESYKDVDFVFRNENGVSEEPFSLAGVTGVYTVASEAKEFDGLTSFPDGPQENAMDIYGADSSVWNYVEGYYPQLDVFMTTDIRSSDIEAGIVSEDLLQKSSFYIPTSDITITSDGNENIVTGTVSKTVDGYDALREVLKAYRYSQASTAAVMLDHWDSRMNIATGLISTDSDWMAVSDNAMEYDPETGYYTVEFKDVPAGTYEFKIQANNTSTYNYGYNKFKGDNCTLVLTDESSDVVIKFKFTGLGTSNYYIRGDIYADRNNDGIKELVDEDRYLGGVRNDSTVWAVVGQMPNADWNLDSTEYDMIQNEADPYIFTLAVPFKLRDGETESQFQFKIVGNRAWATSYGLNGVQDGSNMSFKISADCTVTFEFDTRTHLTTVTGDFVSDADTGARPKYDFEGFSVIGQQKLTGYTWLQEGSGKEVEIAEAGRMTESDEPGIYTKTYTNIPMGDKYAYKVIEDAVDEGANSYFYIRYHQSDPNITTCDVTITYDKSTGKSTASAKVPGEDYEYAQNGINTDGDATTGAAFSFYSVLGDEGLTGYKWAGDGMDLGGVDPAQYKSQAIAKGRMTREGSTENVLWSVTFTDVAPGTYGFKVAVDGDLDYSYGKPGTNENYTIEVTQRASVTITFNPTISRISVTTNPESALKSTTYVVTGSEALTGWVWSKTNGLMSYDVIRGVYYYNFPNNHYPTYTGNPNDPHPIEANGKNYSFKVIEYNVDSGSNYSFSLGTKGDNKEYYLQVTYDPVKGEPELHAFSDPEMTNEVPDAIKRPPDPDPELPYAVLGDKGLTGHNWLGLYDNGYPGTTEMQEAASRDGAMTESPPNSGKYYKTYTNVPVGIDEPVSYSFKVALNGNWDSGVDYGAPDGGDYILTLMGNVSVCDVTIYFDSNTGEISIGISSSDDSVKQVDEIDTSNFIWYVVGDYQLTSGNTFTAPTTVYDTVRDITSSIEFTTGVGTVQKGISWKIDKESNKLYEYFETLGGDQGFQLEYKVDAKGTVTGTFKDSIIDFTLQILEDPNYDPDLMYDDDYTYYLCDNFMPGKQFLLISAFGYGYSQTYNEWQKDFQKYQEYLENESNFKNMAVMYYAILSGTELETNDPLELIEYLDSLSEDEYRELSKQYGDILKYRDGIENSAGITYVDDAPDITDQASQNLVGTRRIRLIPQGYLEAGYDSEVSVIKDQGTTGASNNRVTYKNRNTGSTDVNFTDQNGTDIQEIGYTYYNYAFTAAYAISDKIGLGIYDNYHYQDEINEKDEDGVNNQGHGVVTYHDSLLREGDDTKARKANRYFAMASAYTQTSVYDDDIRYKNIIYVKDTEKWSDVWCYMWNEGQAVKKEQMELISNDIWTYEADQNYEYLIFSNGKSDGELIETETLNNYGPNYIYDNSYTDNDGWTPYSSDDQISSNRNMDLPDNLSVNTLQQQALIGDSYDYNSWLYDSDENADPSLKEFGQTIVKVKKIKADGTIENLSLDSNYNGRNLDEYRLYLKWSGKDIFEPEDEGTYQVHFYWLLSDGRYFEDYKVVQISTIEPGVKKAVDKVYDDAAAINNKYNELKYTVTYTNEKSSNPVTFAIFDILPFNGDGRIVYGKENPDEQVKSTKIADDRVFDFTLNSIAVYQNGDAQVKGVYYTSDVNVRDYMYKNTDEDEYHWDDEWTDDHKKIDGLTEEAARYLGLEAVDVREGDEANENGGQIDFTPYSGWSIYSDSSDNTQDRIVYVKNADGWDNVYCYTWDSNSTPDWPGTLMQNLGNDVWKITIPADAEGFNFNNGGNGLQTGDLKFPGANYIYDNRFQEDNMYITNANGIMGVDANGVEWTKVVRNRADASGSFKLSNDGWSAYIPETQDYGSVVYVKNTAGWDNVYCYTWGGTSSTDWPGLPMESIGNDIYRITIPNGVEGLIFNNNAGTQTENLTYPGPNRIFDNTYKGDTIEGVDKVTAVAVTGIQLAVSKNVEAQINVTYEGEANDFLVNNAFYHALYEDEFNVRQDLASYSNDVTTTIVSRDISGNVWLDYDNNGIWDEGEPPIENVRVNLYKQQAAGGKTWFANTGFYTYTDANGAYAFDKLLSGTYKVVFTEPDFDDGKVIIHDTDRSIKFEKLRLAKTLTEWYVEDSSQVPTGTKTVGSRNIANRLEQEYNNDDNIGEVGYDTPEEDDRVVYVKNNAGWDEVWCHMWGGSAESNTEWPGLKMEYIGDDIWKITIPDDINEFNFNNGNHGLQTGNLTYPGPNHIFDNSFYNNDEGWSDYTPPKEESVVYVKNNAGWDEVYCHTWGNGDGTNTEWPGNKMEYIGDDIWKYIVPDGVTGIIFNGGKDKPQTDDLTYPGTNHIYDNSQKDDSGWSEYSAYSLYSYSIATYEASGNYSLQPEYPNWNSYFIDIGLPDAQTIYDHYLNVQSIPNAAMPDYEYSKYYQSPAVIEVNALKLQKVAEEDASGNGPTPLAGAVFRFEYFDTEDNVWKRVVYNNGEPKFVESDTDGVGEYETLEDGTLEFRNLPDGKYRVTEIVAASGYSKLAGSIEIDLPYAMPTDAADNFFISELDNEDGPYMSPDGKYREVTMQITNTTFFNLPLTGLNDINLWLLIIGIILVLAATATFIYASKKKKKAAQNLTK